MPVSGRSPDAASVGQDHDSTTKPVGPPNPGLIGVDDLEPPEWAAVDEQVATASMIHTLRAMPAAISVVARLAWSAVPQLTTVAVAVHLLSGCATAFGLFATASVFDQLLEAGPTPQRVAASLPSILILVASYSVRAILDGAVSGVEGALIPRIRQAAQDTLNAKVIRVELLAWEDADFRELVRQGGQAGVSRVETSVRGIAEVASSVVSMVAAVVTAGVLNPWLAPVLVLAAAADGWTAMRMAKLGYQSFLKMVSQTLRLFVVENLMVARDVAMERHALTLHDTLLQEDRRIATGITAEAVTLAGRRTRIRMIGRALAGLGTAVAYLVLGLLLYIGSMPLALAATAVVAMRTASSSLSNTMRSINSLYEDSFYLGFYQRLLGEADRRQRVCDGPIAPTDPLEIRAAGLSFAYPGEEMCALQDIDLTIHRGEVVALVGENGSGKSTLAKLLTGLYRPTQGSVTWDGVDLANADTASVHSQIAVIAQEPARWPMTAEANIRIGRLDYTDAGNDRWVAAIKSSGADDVLASLPTGGDTVLSKEFRNGQDLSGGQWQRVAIARGIYRDAPILVADEPTAALDAKAEARVFAALQHAFRANADSSTTRTTILITHRLSNIRHADRIIVLAHGRIVEQGTHDELMSRSDGVYRELFEIQAHAYESGAPSAQRHDRLTRE